MEKQFLKVNMAIVRSLGPQPALLYASIKSIEKVWKQKDKQGYCLIWKQYFMEEFGWGRSMFENARAALIKAHMLDFKPGKGKNSPGKYRTRL